MAASGQRGTGQPRSAGSGSNREREILDAAARLFHERGFARVGVDEIGQLAGISGPAIYRYFSGKDEILATLFDTAMDRLLLLLGQTPEDPAAALERLVAAHVEFAVRDRMLLSVYAREERSLVEPWRRRLQRRQLDHVGRWVSILGRCFPDRPNAEHYAAAYAAISMIHSVSGWPRQARDGVDLTRILVGFVERGLGELRQVEPAAANPAGRRSPGTADNDG